MTSRSEPYSFTRECLYCGKEFTLRSKRKVYCSNNCGAMAWSKGQRVTPPTKSAICLGCGEEFTRDEHYPSAMRYCSNKCSHSEVKRVRDKYLMDLDNAVVVFRSLWEVRFVAACERFNYPWRRYDRDLIRTPAGNYRPDFILGGEYIVEIKGRMDLEDVIKTESAKKQFGDRYLLILEEDLINFEQTGALDLGKLIKS